MLDEAFDCCCMHQERFRAGGAQALVCNGWQSSVWDLITHEESIPYAPPLQTHFDQNSFLAD